jgi:hypothetical protein
VPKLAIACRAQQCRNRQRGWDAVLIIAAVVVVVVRVAAAIKSIISEAAAEPAPESSPAKSSVVKSPVACKVTESSAAKSSAAVAAAAETTAVETASQTTPVEATSAKAPAVAASTATTSQRFMVGEHQSAGKQRNDGNRQFLPHDIPLLLQRRVALDSSAVHLRPAIFPISAVRHDCLLPGWCDAGF